jgi:glucans biosynthesis protein C
MENGSAAAPSFQMERIHYFDHLRSLALILGILVHACFPYGTGFLNSWFFRDQSTSLSFSYGFLFLHLFRMPLFFFIAGFFANFLVHKRGVKGFVKNRLSRIGLPFIIFLPLLLIGSGVLIVTSILVVPKENMNPAISQAAENYRKNASPVKASQTPAASKPGKAEPAAAPQKADRAANSNDSEQDPVITQHLWFLYYLVFFCLTAAILHRLHHDSITKIFSKFFSSSLYLWLVPWILVPALHTVGIPASTPGHIIPRLWPFGYYGVFFLLGWHFFYHRDYLDRLRTYQWTILFSGLFVAFLLLYLMPSQIPLRSLLPSWMAFDLKAIPMLPEKTILVVLEAYASVLLVAASLLLGKRFLNSGNKTIRFISDASYWVYLIHFPLVTILQAFLVRLPISIYVKFFASSAMVMGIGLLTYRYLVRYTFIGTMLNGKRIKEKTPSSPEPMPSPTFYKME